MYISLSRMTKNTKISKLNVNFKVLHPQWGNIWGKSSFSDISSDTERDMVQFAQFIKCLWTYFQTLPITAKFLYLWW